MMAILMWEVDDAVGERERERDDRSRERDKRAGDRTERVVGRRRAPLLTYLPHLVLAGRDWVADRRGTERGSGDDDEDDDADERFSVFLFLPGLVFVGKSLHIDADDADDDAAPRCRDSGWKLLRRAARGGG
jgi:hypothetical protein